MALQTWTLTDTARGIYEPQFHLSQSDLAGQAGAAINKMRLSGGLADGVDLVEINTGRFQFSVLPTRGMGLWRAALGDLQLGWKSPVQGPVHPQFVPVGEPSGLGWLDGFDELLCRCGLESNGAPEFDDDGRVKYPLHGRIANRPAHKVELSYDSASGEIRLIGEVDENRFHFQRLRLTTTYITKLGSSGVKIVDKITNHAGRPAEAQMLYHINFGLPLVDPGSRLVAPIKTIVPRTPHAAAGLKNWDSYGNEEVDNEEQVYFFELAGAGDGRTAVLLKNAHSVQGVRLRYNTRQLKCFSLWKNTAAAADGYVTGIEPGTNFPNPRSFEGKQGRVAKLKAGESVTYELELDALPDAAAVKAAEAEIEKLQAGTKPEVFNTPQAGWVAGV